MKREETVDYNIKATWLAISRMYNQHGQPFELTATTGFVLLNIDVEHGTPATKIAPMLGMESRSLTRILKAMEDKNWIYREKDTNDGRSVRIHLTELGKEKRELSRLSVREFNRKVRANVGYEALTSFFNVLNSINQIIEKNVLFNQLETETEYEENH